MLEKIGLPAKPSMRGANWVVDASHCQGCSSQFTFINRKHHCRRCGGLFCNTCTQQRMILRGQGDSAVRICDPCKKLEDAARFQLRHGYKTRTAKASLKLVPKKEDEIVKQLLEADGAYPSSSAGDSQLNPVSSLKRVASSTSCSNLQEESKCSEDVADTIRSISTVQNELGPSSPKELRKQAAEEKQRYKVLKGEGKSGEALLAYKRGKELERQATALEITIRKNRRLASVQTTNEDEAVADSKRISSQKSKAQKDDLASELRELGWSDADLHDTDKKTESLSAESELSKLLREIPRTSPVDRALSSIDKTQVLAHKKKAVMLKKDGKMAEAKEELKRAKILEKQLEEQELLLEAEDSDDELSTLIRNINDGKEDEHSFDTHDPGINFDQFNGLGDDLAVGCNFDVTDDDMNDPDIASTLKSFGWSEDVDPNPDRHSLQFVPVDNEKLKDEVLSLKKEAVNQKKAGNMAEAMGLLRKAKLLERDLQNSQTEEQMSGPVSSLNVSKSLAEKCPMATEADSKLPRKNKLVIQKELLSLKKKALALRREGRAEEAEEELKKGKDLEHQLEEMDIVPKLVETNIGKKSILKPAHAYQDPSLALDLLEEADVAEVTDQDMTDPSLLSVLENLGWKEDVKSTSGGNASELTHNQAKFVSDPILVPKRRARNKAEIQRELLSVKRKALALRRQGKSQEAEEELIKAKDLENELTETEVTHPYEYAEKFSGGSGSLAPEKKPENLIKTRGAGVREDAIKDYPHPDPSLMLNFLKEVDEAEVTEQDMKDPALLSVLEKLGWKEGVEFANTQKSSKLLHDQPIHDYNISSLPAMQARGKAEIQRELLGIKRKALGLRQQGKSEEAEEELIKAKDLENRLAETEVTHPSEYTVTSSGGSSILVPVKMPETLTVTGAGEEKKEVKPIGITESAIKSMDDLKSNDPALRRQGKVGESEELKKTKDLENLLPDLEVVQPSSIAETSDGFTTLVPGSQQEDTGFILNRDDDMLSLLMGTAPKKGNVIVEYSGPNLKKENYPSDLVRSSVSVPEVSRFESLVPQPTKNVELLPMSSPHANFMDSFTSDEQEVRSMEEQKPVEIKITIPNVSPPANLIDFLTGNEQKVLPIPHIKHEEKPAGSTVQLDAVLGSEQDTISCNKTPDQTSNLLGVEKTVHGGPQINQVPVIEANLAHEFVSPKEQVLARKRKALFLKREGNLEEAREELRQAKLLEKRLEGESQQGSINRENQQADINSRNTSTSVYHPAKQESVHESFLQPQKPGKQKSVPGSSSQPQKPTSGRNRFKLQQESLAHKRRALKLRREGKMEESEAEFELAKELESQIEELDSHAPNACKSVVKADEDAVEGFLDPQLMSALKAIGWQEADIGMLASSKPEAKPQVKQEARKDTGKNTSISSSKDHLEEQIKAEKLRALNLKQAGKQAEALDALRSAKQLEKQLLSLAS